MEIAVDGDAMVVLQEFGNQSLHVIYCGKGLLDGVLVLPVEVGSCQVTSGVANNNSVRVDHRDDLEYVTLPQSHC